MLAGVGKQILGKQRLLELEKVKGGFSHTDAQVTRKELKDLEHQRDKLDARYCTDRFEEMV